MICAKNGTVHDPVSIALPSNVAVSSFVLVNAAGIFAYSPLIVVCRVFAEAEDAVVLRFDWPVVRLNGEQPTKFGAVELTAAHS